MNRLNQTTENLRPPKKELIGLSSQKQNEAYIEFEKKPRQCKNLRYAKSQWLTLFNKFKS